MSSLDTAPLRGGVSFGRWACALFVAQNKEHRAVGERYMGGPLDRLTLQAPLSPQPLPGFTNPVTVRKSPGGGFRLGTTAAVNWPGPLANPNPATSDDRRVCLDANPEPADSNSAALSG